MIVNLSDSSVQTRFRRRKTESCCKHTHGSQRNTSMGGTSSSSRPQRVNGMKRCRKSVRRSRGSREYWLRAIKSQPSRSPASWPYPASQSATSWATGNTQIGSSRCCCPAGCVRAAKNTVRTCGYNTGRLPISNFASWSYSQRQTATRLSQLHGSNTD